jgi:L-amino acid N-acyltransferase YncA
MIHTTRIDAQAWKEIYSENAHLIAFSKHKPATSERIDFALIVAKDALALGYVTCRELDAETVYWQFGGAFPSAKDTILSWQGYANMAEWCKVNGYKRITTLIENLNMPMLKMAMKVGFRVIGCRTFGGKVYLENLLEFASGT